ncbi:platelet-activating factor acetylhydrolase IB subunit alpha2-like [Amphiura filiformis]|uniref:platelet-activating factor acetylhydrolase IB subunit alpha2-like n=1 Tax=Amphiura filiformis TaxID=82378 RepID=UPI003B224AA2
MSNPAAIPVPVEDVQGDNRWMSIHTQNVAACKDKEPEVLFVGDSLVQLMPHVGDKLWEKFFEPLHCLNIGVGGDATQHVLWRLHNGEIECIKPKAVVVLVGTNNHGHTAGQVAGGIEAIVRFISEKQPQAHIIVLALPPRGKTPNPLREKNAAVNKLLAKLLPTIPRAELLDAVGDFVQSDGTINPLEMYDYLHFTSMGYEKIFEPLQMRLEDLLSSK